MYDTLVLTCVSKTREVFENVMRLSCLLSGKKKKNQIQKCRNFSGEKKIKLNIYFRITFHTPGLNYFPFPHLRLFPPRPGIIKTVQVLKYNYPPLWDLGLPNYSEV